MRMAMMLVATCLLVACGGNDGETKDNQKNPPAPPSGGVKIDSPVVGKWQGEYKQKPLSKLAEPDERELVKITLDLKPDGTFTDTDGDGEVTNGTYVLDVKDNSGTINLQYPNLNYKFQVKLEGDKLKFSEHRFERDGKERVPDQLKIDDFELTRV